MTNWRKSHSIPKNLLDLHEKLVEWKIWKFIKGVKYIKKIHITHADWIGAFVEYFMWGSFYTSTSVCLYTTSCSIDIHHFSFFLLLFFMPSHERFLYFFRAAVAVTATLSYSWFSFPYFTIITIIIMLI